MVALFTAVLLVQISVLRASGRDTRLLLHSDGDVIQELVKMKAELAALNSTYRTELEALNRTYRTELEAMNGTYKSEVAALSNTIDALNKTHRSELETTKQAHQADILNLMSQMSNTFKEHGSTYIRWGRTTCGGGNGTQLIYKGYMAGNPYDETGNGANPQCLPEDPTWGNYDDTANGDVGHMYGAEFETFSNTIFGKPVADEDVPCAVCYVPATTLMIPARTNCYPGWSVEYTGYLMTSYHDRSRPSNYVCVDADPEFVTRGASNTNGHLLYPVEGICGTLVCPPYYNHRELACSVCSKRT